MFNFFPSPLKGEGARRADEGALRRGPREVPRPHRGPSGAECHDRGSDGGGSQPQHDASTAPPEPRRTGGATGWMNSPCSGSGVARAVR